ncbi:hypothetical protein [Petroclostridium sp. X23]|uniref:hypothetical protein n=1 Tax=Petroclostridium sp. X23 TaxID=3045146 RepID=UPI0024ADA8F8|nr:hypothetical protein [Petroclostridium sp. X23]WHH58288.1 hypothetical protein QKW49_21190 [Petroclostridium sp. X23]
MHIFTLIHLLMVLICIAILGFAAVFFKKEPGEIWKAANTDYPDEEDPVQAAPVEEINRAKVDLYIAMQDFDYAEQAFVDTSIYRMKAAEERLNVLSRLQKAG